MKTELVVKTVSCLLARGFVIVHEYDDEVGLIYGSVGAHVYANGTVRYC
jgi:hypothetical protein